MPHPSPEKSKGMADKAEKDLDQASDCGWVRGLDANGNPIKLNKTDVVELIRREMPVATKDTNGLMSNEDKLSQLRYIAGKGFHRVVMLSAHFYQASFLITLTKVASIRASTFFISFKGAEEPIIKALVDGGAACDLYYRTTPGVYEIWAHLPSEAESFAYIEPICLFGADFSEVFSEVLPDNTIAVNWGNL